MDLSRRSVVVGLGLLATGSGATFTSAAFNDSTNSNGDIRVVAGDGLVVEAGDAFNSDGTVNQTDPSPSYSYTGNFTKNKSFFTGPDNLDEISTSDLPVATVNKRETVANRNDGLRIQVAVPLQRATYTFKNILRIRNTGVTEQKNIGIAYASSEFDGYGSAVGNGSNEIAKGFVQKIFQFKLEDESSNSLISPDPSSSNSQEPNTEADISPGDDISITLDVFLKNYVPAPGFSVDLNEKIRNAADLNDDPFSGTIDTVQLLKQIRVGQNY